MSLNSKSERSYKAALMGEKKGQGGVSNAQREAPSSSVLTQPTKQKPREPQASSPAPTTPGSSFTTPTNTSTGSSARERRMKMLTPFSPPKRMDLDAIDSDAMRAAIKEQKTKLSSEVAAKRKAIVKTRSSKGSPRKLNKNDDTIDEGTSANPIVIDSPDPKKAALNKLSGIKKKVRRAGGTARCKTSKKSTRKRSGNGNNGKSKINKKTNDDEDEELEVENEDEEQQRSGDEDEELEVEEEDEEHQRGGEDEELDGADEDEEQQHSCDENEELDGENEELDAKDEDEEQQRI